MALFGRTPVMPTPEQALPGRRETMPVPATHFVNGHPLTPPFSIRSSRRNFALQIVCAPVSLRVENLILFSRVGT